jgi:hypothetical protein
MIVKAGKNLMERVRLKSTLTCDMIVKAGQKKKSQKIMLVNSNLRYDSQSRQKNFFIFIKIVNSNLRYDSQSRQPANLLQA